MSEKTERLDEESITLPFSQLKQNALLGHLLVNEQFFKIAHRRIKPKWFLSERNSQIFKFLCGYYEKYAIYPTPSEFREYPEFLAMEPKDRNILFSFISRNIAETQQIHLEVIKLELTEWLHSVILMRGMEAAKDLYNKNEIKDCYQTLMEAIRDVASSRFDGGEQITFSNYKEYLVKAKEERVEAMTTGLSVLDRMLLKGSTNGGLQRGDTTVVMAPVNIGKTTCLITMACHNIRSAKDVLFMTHEGRPDDIRLMFLANMMGVSRDGVISLYNDPSNIPRLEAAVRLLDKHLKYIPYNKAGMAVEEVIPIIRSSQEDWLATHDGKGFDLLVNDYPALLLTDLAKKGSLQKRSSDQIVYDNFVQLALEYKFHSLLAIQTNREGSKVNKGVSQVSEKRLLTMEDVQESWGPIERATNVITLNRNPFSQLNNIIIYGIAKSRGNKTGVAVMAQSDFGKCNTHSEDMGAVGYSGTKTAEEYFQIFMDQYRNQEIPETVCRQFSL